MTDSKNVRLKIRREGMKVGKWVPENHDPIESMTEKKVVEDSAIT